MNRRADGLWREKVRLPNGKDKYFYGKTKAELIRKVMAFKTTTTKGIPFPDLARLWWDEIEGRIAHNTAKSYKPAMERCIERFFNRRCTEISTVEVFAHISDFAKTHADKTVRTQLMVYRLIFAYAVKKGYVPYNIARELTVPQDLPKRKVTMPSSEDIAKIKSSIDCTFGFFLYMALYTGMRRGELLALEWKDIDFKSGMIRVDKSVYNVSNVPYIKPPKTTKSVGAVPILDALRPELEKRKGKGLVFPNADGGLMSESQFKHYWRLYLQESQVNCTPHQLRHAYATMLFENGIPPEDAQVLLRHAQISTTMDIYTDIRETKQKDIYSRVKSIDII